MTLRRGGRVVECTALEMRHTREGIVGSNPTLSAMYLRKLFFGQFLSVLGHCGNRTPPAEAAFRLLCDPVKEFSYERS